MYNVAETALGVLESCEFVGPVRALGMIKVS